MNNLLKEFNHLKRNKLNNLLMGFAFLLILRKREIISLKKINKCSLIKIKQNKMKEWKKLKSYCDIWKNKISMKNY